MNVDFCIYPPHEAFYLTSLMFCTESALSSVAAVKNFIEAEEDGNNELPPQVALDQLQNIANQGAAISRYFWPVKKEYRNRSKALKTAFCIDDSSPLRDRTLRNMVEHFDEKLDDFLKGYPSGMLIPDYFGTKPSGDRGPLKFFRAYFINTDEFEILGNVFQIQPIVDEIFRIHQILLDCIKDGSRFPR
jgi:hypothetical protein